MKDGRAMGMSYKTAEATNYCKEFIEYVKEEADKQGWVKSDNPDLHYYVDAVFYFPRSRMDCNNYWKILLDSITDSEAVWVDDDIVCERAQGIFYDTDNPRIELVITPVEYRGIFESEASKNIFINKCESCKRYRRNCSLLNKALHGKVQKEIHDGECDKHSFNK